MNTPYIFRQLFDEKTWTYTYILGDADSRQAVIIDPVRDKAERDLRLLQELDLHLAYILDTHIHADHITGSGILRERTGAKIVMGTSAKSANPDILLENGEDLTVGSLIVKGLATPGHTDACMTFYCQDRIFTGDSLLIRKTGRTDFQQGSPEKLYHSIQERIYTLPDETLIYPGHDYNGLMVSSVGEEKKYNSRIKADTGLEEFVKIMSDLELPYPKYIDEALPANMKLGVTE